MAKESPFTTHTLSELETDYGLVELTVHDTTGRLQLRFENRVELWEPAPADWPITGDAQAIVVSGVTYRPLRVNVTKAVTWPPRAH